MPHDRLIDRLPAPVITVDAWSEVRSANPAARRLLGPESVGARLTELVDPADAARVEAWVGSVLDGDPDRSVFLGPLEVTWSGQRRTCDLAAAVLRVGAESTLVVSIRDLTPLYADVQSAAHDPLTGVLNRAALYGRAGAVLAQAGGVLLFADLDDFKSVNDAHGHDAGDVVLVEAARRLVAVLGPEAVVARFGGDEFVAVLPGTPLAVGRERARRLVDAIRLPIPVGEEEILVSASVGVAEIDQVLGIDDAVRAADTAMYVAKREGRDQVVSFDDGLRSMAQRRASLIEENAVLRSAAVRYSVEARTDAGTGLPNLRRLLEDLALVHDRAVRDGAAYSVVFLDLDHFGTLNKKYGDAVGDETLVSVARVLTEVMREDEIVYRKGGEELVAILWGADLEGAAAAADRYRRALLDAALPHGGHDGTPVVTASFGVAQGPGAGEAADVLREASLCMLSAKADGRNRVSTVPLPVPEHPRSA